MQVIETAPELRDLLSEKKRGKNTIGFVPTMGALHRGHSALIKRSINENDLTVCSIFINPLQFNSREDLNRYPRDIEGDRTKLEDSGCEILFHPSYDEIYPDGEPDEYIHPYPGKLTEIAEGAFRPGHFRGMAIVVKRLFDIVQPDKAYFGLKDYQQFLIVRQMVDRDKSGIDVIGCETIREKNGLALSSRNRLLSREGMERAAVFFRCLKQARDMIRSDSIDEIRKMVQNEFSAVKDAKLQYFQIADSHTLEEVETASPNQSLIACIAGFVDGVRLIDNLILIP